MNLRVGLIMASSLLHPLEKHFLYNIPVLRVQVAGLKFFKPKPPVDSSEWPEVRKLRTVIKQPEYASKPPKMFKMIRIMRGPEPVHNELLYKGFGVKALLGGRLMSEHFEAIRKIVNIKIDTDRMFAIWRVEMPWQPLAKKGIGKTLGGGKGAIHHYCTPVKADRIIVELGGNIHEIEAERILTAVANILPFPARFVSHRDLLREKANEEWISRNNINPYDMEYVIRNNMGGCRKSTSKYDNLWYGKYK